LRCFTCVKEHHFYMFYWQYASNWAHSCFQPGNLYGQCEQISYISIHYLVLLAAGKPVTSSSHWEIGIFIVMVWLSLKKENFIFLKMFNPTNILAISRPIVPWASLRDSTSCHGMPRPKISLGATNIWQPMLVYILRLHNKVLEMP